MDQWTNNEEVIPKAANLEHFANFSEIADGFLLSDIDEKNNWIEVQAKDIVLKIAIIDKNEGLVLVQSQGHGKFFIVPEICRLNGSTLGGSFLKIRWVGVGFNLELDRLKEEPFSNARRVTTSTIQTVIVWNDSEMVNTFLQSV